MLALIYNAEYICFNSFSAGTEYEVLCVCSVFVQKTNMDVCVQTKHTSGITRTNLIQR